MPAIELEVPEILNIPEKLWPLLTEFNNYSYFVIEGGRASAKTQSVGRCLTYIAEKREVRIFCGREIQDTIEESVYAVLADLVREHELAFDVKKSYIRHHVSGSEFKFKGFRERGAVNIKGVEGADIIWIDEAQTITKPTLDVLIPTVRKQKSKIIFTMNRYLRSDAVISELVGRPDVLHIKINYIDNPHCTLKIKNEAEILKNKNRKEFDHIYMGVPLAQADDYLMNYLKLEESMKIVPFGETFYKQRVMGIDFAAQGNDQCVATILDRLTNQHWGLTEQIPWDEPDTTVSSGKIVSLVGEHKPDIVVFDIGGLGKPVFDVLEKIKSLEKILFAFDGGSTIGVDEETYANRRAQSYFELRDEFDLKHIVIHKKNEDVITQLEKIKFKYRSNGVKLMEDKLKMKATIGESPDKADSLMMAVYGAKHLIGKARDKDAATEAATTKRVNRSKRGNR